MTDTPNTDQPLDLDAIEARARAATPGPWRVGADLVGIHPGWVDSAGNANPNATHRNGYAKRIATVGKEDDWRGIETQVSDAAHIAGMDPTTTLALLAEVRKLRKIGRAILEADERGQGTPFAEAMEAMSKALGDPS